MSAERNYSCADCPALLAIRAELEEMAQLRERAAGETTLAMGEFAKVEDLGDEHTADETQPLKDAWRKKGAEIFSWIDFTEQTLIKNHTDILAACIGKRPLVMRQYGLVGRHVLRCASPLAHKIMKSEATKLLTDD